MARTAEAKTNSKQISRSQRRQLAASIKLQEIFIF